MADEAAQAPEDDGKGNWVPWSKRDRTLEPDPSEPLPTLGRTIAAPDDEEEPDA